MIDSDYQVILSFKALSFKKVFLTVGWGLTGLAEEEASNKYLYLYILLLIVQKYLVISQQPLPNHAKCFIHQVITRNSSD